ncbi:MAG: DUF5060 domain-containing protein, partial [Planctomycetes bacterium]|nr:DUF5060 domain-containing protein [Planctomycetota bacterium]
DGLFYSATTPTPLRPGCWNPVEVDLSKDSIDLLPEGHTSRWSLLRLCTIQMIGFAVWSDQPFQSDNDKPGQQVLLDDITTWPLDSATVRAREKFSITSLHVDTPEVRQYDPFELSCWVNRPVINPFDQEHIRIDAQITPPDGGDVITVPLFYYQDFLRHQEPPADRYTAAGPGIFKLRFTPRQSGTYHYRLTANYTSLDEMPGVEEEYESRDYSFEVTAGDQPGFIRRSKVDPLYFEYENGSFYFPVGHNFRSPNDLRDWEMILKKKTAPPEDRGLNIYEDYLPKMAAAGEDLIEVWMSSWWLGLEWNPRWKGYHGIGFYNQENAWKLDALIALCEKYGIKVQIVIDNHGKASMKPQYDYEWYLSPYNITQQDSKLGNNGFLRSPEQLFDLKQNPRVRKHYRNKLRYIAARWGFSTTIFSFEMWSELDLIGQPKNRHRNVYAHQNVRDWHQEMIDYLNRMDHGRHVVTTHYSGKYHYVDRAMVRLPEIDFIACDGYRDANESLIDLLLQTDNFARDFKKPYLITEFGGKWNAAEPNILEGDLHAGLWVSWMSQAAGTPLFWWFEHIERADLYHHYNAFAKFIEGEDKRRGEEQKPLVSCKANIMSSLGASPAQLRSLGISDGSITYLWIYDLRRLYLEPSNSPHAKHAGFKVTIPKLEEGKYAVELWDTSQGELVSELNLATIDHNLTFNLPEFSTDIAVKVKPYQLPEK